MSLIALYYVCSVGIQYNVYRFKKHGTTHDNKIIKMLKSFLFNSENSVIHSYIYNNIQLLHLNEINMRFYRAEYNNIERGEAEFNIVVLCSIKTHIDQVQV